MFAGLISKIVCLLVGHSWAPRMIVVVGTPASAEVCRRCGKTRVVDRLKIAA